MHVQAVSGGFVAAEGCAFFGYGLAVGANPVLAVGLGGLFLRAAMGFMGVVVMSVV
jgi:hypothetical protein